MRGTISRLVFDRQPVYHSNIADISDQSQVQIDVVVVVNAWLMKPNDDADDSYE